jgi:hypothetical protein
VEHQVVPAGTRIGTADLRVIAVTSTRLPIGPRPQRGADRRPRSRYLLVSHAGGGLALVDSGVGPSMVPKRGRGVAPVGLLGPWDFLAAIEVSPVQLTSVVLTGLERERVSNLGRLPAGIPVYCDDHVIRRGLHGGRVPLMKTLTGRIHRAQLGRAADNLRAVDWLPPASWHGVRGFDLFGDGACLLIPLSDRRSGHLGLLMPRVERLADPLVYLTRPDLRISAEDGNRALEAMPPEIRQLMRLGCRVMHAADPDPTELDVVEI